MARLTETFWSYSEVKMVKGRVDVLLPTSGERINGLIFQIQAILNQSHKDLRLWTLIDNDQPKILRDIIRSRVNDDVRHKMVTIPEEWRGGWGHKPIKYAIENLPLDGEWLITTGDDDVVMEWALEELVANGSDVDMVVGLCVPVRRNHDCVNIVLGEKVELGRITGSCCLYKTERVKELGYDDNLYEADWILIEKMSKYPYKQIESALFVMPQDYGKHSTYGAQN